MFVLIGLENEGGRGTFARHAVGARFLDYVHRHCGISRWQHTDDGNAEISKGVLGSADVVLIRMVRGKLHTCGEVLLPHLLCFADPRNIIVAYDEALLEPGQSRFDAATRDDNGHLGIRSLTKVLCTDRFVRAMVGIGRIPAHRAQFESFFNAVLGLEDAQIIEDTFCSLLKDVSEYCNSLRACALPQKLLISSNVMFEAQLSNRRRNVWLAPCAVTIARAKAKHLTDAVKVLVRLIQGIAKKYARACDNCENPALPLVRLLESGIPLDMIPLVRHSRFHIEHLSFDFQSDKLLEINSAPMPPFQALNARRLLSRPGPGADLTPGMVSERVEILANRFRLNSRRGAITLLSQVGEVLLGEGGWFSLVKQSLEERGWIVRIGLREPEDEVVWANLTWMTPERSSSVIGSDWSTIQIFPSPRNFLFTSKRFLVALCRPHEREILGISKGDGETLDAVLPWSGVLDEERHTLRWMLSHHSDKFYGKPFLASGGRGGSSITRMTDLQRVERPAIVQEWIEPYHMQDTDFAYDIRIVVYGIYGQNQVWSSRVWEHSSTLQKPLDAPVVFD